jgi:nitrate reductase alpha subunit
MIIHGAGTNHWFHNDLINRSFILLVALTGNVGKNGGGFNHYVGQERIWPEHGFFQLAFPEGRKKQRFQNTTLWSYVHSSSKDPHLYNGKPIDWYIQESVKNGWMPLWPKGGRKPRAFIVWRANYLNQAKGNEILESSLWRDLDLIVDINYRMDTTALYSDIVLPAASYYEKVDINTTDCHSYVHPFGKALEPLFESKTDWDIFHALAEKMAELATKKGLKPFHDDAFGTLAQPALKDSLAGLWQQLCCTGDFPDFAWFKSYQEYEATYIALFDVGIPEPPVSLFESAHDKTRPPQEIALENTWFCDALGLRWDSSCAVPDYLITQLEFLAAVHYTLENTQDSATGCSLAKLETDFLGRHMLNWVPTAAAKLNSNSPLAFGPLMILLAAFLQNRRDEVAGYR